ncbi:MAG: hypothetical protein LBI63_05835 [Candidatus Ancillula sp.]|jgi:hypothetical protein|nr:hypothetical protein [Candidatus Ancillula sp.]
MNSPEVGRQVVLEKLKALNKLKRVVGIALTIAVTVSMYAVVKPNIANAAEVYPQGEMAQYFSSRPFPDYTRSVNPWAYNYCDGKNFKESANLKDFDSYKNCETMQNYYDKVTKMLQNTEDTTHGTNADQLNMQLALFVDSQYSDTGINLLAVKNGGREDKDINLHYFDDYITWHQKNAENQKEDREKLQESLKLEIDVAKMTVDSDISQLNYYVDYYDQYFDTYKVPFQTEHDWFQTCHLQNNIPIPNSDTKHEDLEKDKCVQKWAETAFASFSADKFYSYSGGTIGDLDDKYIEPRDDQFAISNAVNIAAQMYETEVKIHNFIKIIQEDKQTVENKNKALELRIAMIQPSFDSTNLKDEDFQTLAEGGVDAEALREAKDLQTTGLDPLNGAFAQMRDSSGKPIHLNISGDCAAQAGSVTDAEGFKRCIGTDDDPKFARTDITPILTDQDGTDYKGTLDSSSQQAREALPDPKVVELPEGKSAKDLKFEQHINSAYNSKSSVLAYMKTDTSKYKDRTFISKPGQPTASINKNAVKFRPILDIHLPVGVGYAAQYKIWADVIDSSGNLRTVYYTGDSDNGFWDNYDNTVGRTFTTVFDTNTVKEHVEFKLAGATEDYGIKHLDLEPLYYQYLEGTKDVMGPNAKLVHDESKDMRYGFDEKANNPNTNPAALQHKCTATDCNYDQDYVKNHKWAAIKGIDGAKLALHVDGGAGAWGKFTYTFYDDNSKQVDSKTTDNVLVGGTRNIVAPANASKVKVKFSTSCKDKESKILDLKAINEYDIGAGGNCLYKFDASNQYHQGPDFDGKVENVQGDINHTSVRFEGTINEAIGINTSIRNSQNQWVSSADSDGFIGVDKLTGIKMNYFTRSNMIKLAPHLASSNTWDETSQKTLTDESGTQYLQVGNPSSDAPTINNLRANLIDEDKNGKTNDNSVIVDATYENSGLTSTDGGGVKSAYPGYGISFSDGHYAGCKEMVDVFNKDIPLQIDQNSDLWRISSDATVSSKEKASNFSGGCNADDKKSKYSTDDTYTKTNDVGNIDYANLDSTRYYMNKDAKLKQVGVRFGGSFDDLFTVETSVWQSGKENWTAWIKDGNVAGIIDPNYDIKAIRVRIIPKADSRTAIATIGNLAYVNGTVANVAPQVAYLTQDAHEWKFTNCGNSIPQHSAVEKNLKECGVPNHSVVRLGSDVKGAKGKKTDSNLWTEVFYFDESSVLEAGYATFGDLMTVNNSNNIHVFAYGEKKDMGESIARMQKQVAMDMIHTALSYGSIALIVPQIALHILAPGAAVATDMAFAAIYLATTVGGLVMDIYEQATPDIAPVDMSKRFIYKHDYQGQEIKDLGGHKIMDPNYDNTAKAWTIGGFDWAQYGMYKDQYTLYYQERLKTDPLVVNYNPQVKHIDYNAGEQERGSSALAIDDVSQNGKEHNYNTKQLIPNGSRVWLGLKSDKEQANPDASKRKTKENFVYKEGFQTRAGYLSYGIATDKKAMLASYNSKDITDAKILNFAKQAHVSVDQLIGYIMDGVFIALSAVDFAGSVAKAIKLAPVKAALKQSAEQDAAVLQTMRERIANHQKVSFDIPVADGNRCTRVEVISIDGDIATVKYHVGGAAGEGLTTDMSVSELLTIHRMSAVDLFDRSEHLIGTEWEEGDAVCAPVQTMPRGVYGAPSCKAKRVQIWKVEDADTGTGTSRIVYLIDKDTNELKSMTYAEFKQKYRPIHRYPHVLAGDGKNIEVGYVYEYESGDKMGRLVVQCRSLSADGEYFDVEFEDPDAIPQAYRADGVYYVRLKKEQLKDIIKAHSATSAIVDGGFYMVQRDGIPGFEAAGSYAYLVKTDKYSYELRSYDTAKGVFVRKTLTFSEVRDLLKDSKITLIYNLGRVNIAGDLLGDLMAQNLDFLYPGNNHWPAEILENGVKRKVTINSFAWRTTGDSMVTFTELNGEVKTMKASEFSTKYVKGSLHANLRVGEIVELNTDDSSTIITVVVSDDKVVGYRYNANADKWEKDDTVLAEARGIYKRSDISPHLINPDEDVFQIVGDNVPADELDKPHFIIKGPDGKSVYLYYNDAGELVEGRSAIAPFYFYLPIKQDIQFNDFKLGSSVLYKKDGKFVEAVVISKTDDTFVLRLEDGSDVSINKDGFNSSSFKRFMKDIRTSTVIGKFWYLFQKTEIGKELLDDIIAADIRVLDESELGIAAKIRVDGGGERCVIIRSSTIGTVEHDAEFTFSYFGEEELHTMKVSELSTKYVKGSLHADLRPGEIVELRSGGSSTTITVVKSKGELVGYRYDASADKWEKDDTVLAEARGIYKRSDISPRLIDPYEGVYQVVGDSIPVEEVGKPHFIIKGPDGKSLHLYYNSTGELVEGSTSIRFSYLPIREDIQFENFQVDSHVLYKKDDKFVEAVVISKTDDTFVLRLEDGSDVSITKVGFNSSSFKRILKGIFAGSTFGHVVDGAEYDLVVTGLEEGTNGETLVIAKEKIGDVIYERRLSITELRNKISSGELIRRAKRINLQGSGASIEGSLVSGDKIVIDGKEYTLTVCYLQDSLEAKWKGTAADLPFSYRLTAADGSVEHISPAQLQIEIVSGRATKIVPVGSPVQRLSEEISYIDHNVGKLVQIRQNGSIGYAYVEKVDGDNVVVHFSNRAEVTLKKVDFAKMVVKSSEEVHIEPEVGDNWYQLVFTEDDNVNLDSVSGIGVTGYSGVTKFRLVSLGNGQYSVIMVSFSDDFSYSLAFNYSEHSISEEGLRDLFAKNKVIPTSKPPARVEAVELPYGSTGKKLKLVNGAKFQIKFRDEVFNISVDAVDFQNQTVRVRLADYFDFGEGSDAYNFLGRYFGPNARMDISFDDLSHMIVDGSPISYDVKAGDIGFGNGAVTFIVTKVEGGNVTIRSLSKSDYTKYIEGIEIPLNVEGAETITMREMVFYRFVNNGLPRGGEFGLVPRRAYSLNGAGINYKIRFTIGEYQGQKGIILSQLGPKFKIQLESGDIVTLHIDELREKFEVLAKGPYEGEEVYYGPNGKGNAGVYKVSSITNGNIELTLISGSPFNGHGAELTQEVSVEFYFLSMFLGHLIPMDVTHVVW